MINTTIGRRGLRCAAWGLAFIVVAAAPATTRGDNGRMSGRAREKASQAQGSSRVDVLVKFRQAPGDAERAAVQRHGGSVRRQLQHSSRWMALRLPAHRLQALADDPTVEYIGIDEPVSTAMDTAREASNLPAAPAPETSLTGAGVGVAVVDSGVALHPDILTLTTVVDLV